MSAVKAARIPLTFLLLLFILPGWAHGQSSDALTVTPNGNVGVGTANPGQKLQVEGNIMGHRLMFPGVYGDSGVAPDYYSIIHPAGSLFGFARK